MVLDPNVWIADSAATVHSTGHQVGMFDIKKVSTGGITIANGEEQKIKLFGSLKGTMCDQHGDQQAEAVIENVKLVPTQKFNLFSTTKLQTKGWQLGGNKNSMWLEKDNKKIVFDIMLKTEEGVLFAMYFKRDTEIAGATIDTKTKMSVMTAHEKLGHCSEELTRKTAKALNPKTGRVHETRDAIWLKRMFYEKQGSVDMPLTIEFDQPEENPSVEVGEGNTQVQESVEEADVTETTKVTKSGRTVTKPTRYIEEIGASTMDYKIELTRAEQQYYDAMRQCVDQEVSNHEFACVGAGIGGGFTNTQELHVMKFGQAMATNDKEHWEKAVVEEHERMKDHGVYQVVPRDKVPKEAKIITSTWAMKKKSNGTFRARLNARGFEQVDGIHYDEDTKASPVVSDTTIRIVLILAIMAKWHLEVLDVKGAFLHGEFEEGEEIYMEVPQGFEKYYPENSVILLLKTLYGLKQAALAFWRKLVMAFAFIHFKRSKADPCLYFAWTKFGLVLWLSWIDDLAGAGSKKGVEAAKKDMKQFDCDEVGEMTEYVGCKIDYRPQEGMMRLTQPVLLQSFKDEFELPDEETPATPAVPGSVLIDGEIDTNQKELSSYRTRVGKFLHMARWTRPEILNAVRELSRFMSKATQKHLTAMKRAMHYCVSTPQRGLLLKPDTEWDGNQDFEFIVKGRSDSDYAKDPNKRGVSGYSTFLCGAPTTMKSKMQNCVTLSVTEAELVSATTCAQDMLFVMRVLESIGLKVKKPMILQVDNKGAKDLAHNWSIGGRTRHVDVRE